MRRLYILLLFILTTASLSAQGVFKRGLAFGADRDTLQYIIASPFDNWYLNIGGGLQTFIGNETDASARHNTLDYNAHLEVGKWIIPDLAVSVRFSFMSVHGQSNYSLQPFIDFTGVPVDPSNNRPGYQKFSEHAMSLLGFVTLDWTNFFKGYEQGKHSRWHIFTPVGLGASMLFGTQKNPQNKAGDVGDFRRNFELAFAFGLGTEYVVSPEFALNASLELFGSESTWDWSPYDNSHTIFDLIPSVNVNAKFNLLKYVTKYDLATKKKKKDKVNHEFISFGTRNTVNSLNGRIERLNYQKDSIQNLADNRGYQDSITIDSIDRILNGLEHQRYSLNDVLAAERSPQNIFDELININETLNLPATIVYFELDKYRLDYNARKRLEDFAKEARQHGDTVQFYIIGAADSLTGSIRHNQWLSERRSEAAFNMLVDNFGMNGNQLIRVSVGGITEYDPKEDNRMAMIILKTPVTEEIVDRWLRRSKSNLKGR